MTAPVTTPTPTITPTTPTQPRPDYNPDRRMEPSRICPSQKQRVVRRIEKDLP